MTKELEAFLEKRIRDINYYLKINERSENEKNFPPIYELQICYLAKRMLAIENANPSETLKCVDVLKEDGCITTLYQGKALETIRQALLKAQEQEKVLEIVLEKRVDMYALIITYDLKDYNEMIKHTYELTQEEFELLKRYANE